MQSAVDFVATGLAWIVTLFRLGAVLKSKRRGQGKFLLPWLLALFLSLFMTFQVDVVYTAFDGLTGVNNLSWLLSYLFGAVAVYFICATFCDEPPAWTSIYLCVTAGLLVGVFPFGPGRAAETPDHVVPSNGAELLFLVVFYVYAATMFATIPIPACARTLRTKTLHSDREFPARLRTGVILLTLVLIVVLYLIKLSVFSSSFFISPDFLPLLHLATDVSRIFGGAVGVLWPLVFAPNRFYWALSRPVGFAQKILTMADLKALRARIERLCPPVSQYRTTWPERLRAPDFYIYRDVIKILDGKKLLADYLGQWGRGDSPPEGSSAGLCPASVQRLQEMFYLHQVLVSVPAQSGFEDLVDAYRRIARQLERAPYSNEPWRPDSL